MAILRVSPLRTLTLGRYYAGNPPPTKRAKVGDENRMDVEFSDDDVQEVKKPAKRDARSDARREARKDGKKDGKKVEVDDEGTALTGDPFVGPIETEWGVYLREKVSDKSAFASCQS